MKFLKILFVILGFSALTHAKDKFTDLDLKEHLMKNPKGIIYVVTPHMYLALKGLPEYKAIADKNKIPFLVLLDPNATIKKNMLKLDLSKYPKVDSKEIINRNGIQHFPSYMLYKDGKLETSFNPGYTAPERFEKEVSEYFRE